MSLTCHWRDLVFKASSGNTRSSRHAMSPRGWKGAGVGVGMLRVLGITLLENTKVTKFRFHVFLIDLKFISKILKNLLRDYASLPGATFRIFIISKCHCKQIKFRIVDESHFQTFKLSKSQHFQKLKHQITNFTISHSHISKCQKVKTYKISYHPSMFIISGSHIRNNIFAKMSPSFLVCFEIFW